MKIPKLIAVGVSLCAGLYSCTPNNFGTPEGKAYVPIYMSAAETNDVTVSAARTTEKAGKIYVYGRYIFQNDVNKGIHVIDNADPANPKKIAFLNIPYNAEFAVKGDYLYANNVNDLIVVNIKDIDHPAIVKRLENAFPYVSQQHPNLSGYFVCADPKKGIVVGWELQDVESPKCRR